MEKDQPFLDMKAYEGFSLRIWDKETTLNFSSTSNTIKSPSLNLTDAFSPNGTTITLQNTNQIEIGNKIIFSGYPFDEIFHNDLSKQSTTTYEGMSGCSSTDIPILALNEAISQAQSSMPRASEAREKNPSIFSKEAECAPPNRCPSGHEYEYPEKRSPLLVSRSAQGDAKYEEKTHQQRSQKRCKECKSGRDYLPGRGCGSMGEDSSGITHVDQQIDARNAILEVSCGAVHSPMTKCEVKRSHVDKIECSSAKVGEFPVQSRIDSSFPLSFDSRFESLLRESGNSAKRDQKKSVLKVESEEHVCDKKVDKLEEELIQAREQIKDISEQIKENSTDILHLLKDKRRRFYPYPRNFHPPPMQMYPQFTYQQPTYNPMPPHTDSQPQSLPCSNPCHCNTTYSNYSPTRTCGAGPFSNYNRPDHYAPQHSMDHHYTHARRPSNIPTNSYYNQGNDNNLADMFSSKGRRRGSVNANYNQWVPCESGKNASENVSYLQGGLFPSLDERLLTLEVNRNELQNDLKKERERRREAEELVAKERSYSRKLEDSLQELSNSRVIMDPESYSQMADMYIASRKKPVRRRHTCNPWMNGDSDLTCDGSWNQKNLSTINSCPSSPLGTKIKPQQKETSSVSGSKDNLFPPKVITRPKSADSFASLENEMFRDSSIPKIDRCESTSRSHEALDRGVPLPALPRFKITEYDRDPIPTSSMNEGYRLEEKEISENPSINSAIIGSSMSHIEYQELLESLEELHTSSPP